MGSKHSSNRHARGRGAVAHRVMGSGGGGYDSGEDPNLAGWMLTCEFVRWELGQGYQDTHGVTSKLAEAGVIMERAQGMPHGGADSHVTEHERVTAEAQVAEHKRFWQFLEGRRFDRIAEGTVRPLPRDYSACHLPQIAMTLATASANPMPVVLSGVKEDAEEA